MNTYFAKFKSYDPKDHCGLNFNTFLILEWAVLKVPLGTPLAKQCVVS